MSSQDLKVNLLTHLLYQGGYLAAFTEYGNKGVTGIADVYAMTDALYSHEFEIKISKSDLSSELEAIKYWSWVNENPELFAESKMPRKRLGKGTKHWHYLREQPVHSWISRPNRFSFVVPPYLQEYALKGIKGTPYGLYVINDGSLSGLVERIKKADFLHRERMTQEQVYALLRKGAVEVESLRRKALTQKYAIAESVSAKS